MTCNSTTDPPVARAIRPAVGMACSARAEPSSGTRIRLNISLLLSTSLLLGPPLVWRYISSSWMKYSLPLSQLDHSRQHVAHSRVTACSVGLGYLKSDLCQGLASSPSRIHLRPSPRRVPIAPRFPCPLPSRNSSALLERSSIPCSCSSV